MEYSSSPLDGPIPSTSFPSTPLPKRPAKKIPPPLELLDNFQFRPPPPPICPMYSPLPPAIKITGPSKGEETMVGGNEAGGNRPKGKSRKKGHGRSKSAQTWATADPIWRQQFDLDDAILRLQTDGGMLTGRPMHQQQQSSPSMKSNITVPKRRYSVWRKDSLIDMDTPEFTEMERRLRKSVPSSPQTVLALSGLFVCGFMLLLSGTIVLFSEDALLFRLAGLFLLLLGLLSLLICGFVQRKNISKWLTDMTRDLFALREATTPDDAGASGIGQVPGSFIRQ